MKIIELSSELNSIKNIQQFIEDLGDAYNINDTYFGNILIAVTEAVKNAMMHGNCNAKDKKVRLGFWQEHNKLFFEVNDEGKGFDFNILPDPIENENDGRGLYLIHQLADNVEFSDNGKSITMNFELKGINTDIARDRMNSLRNYSEKKIKRPSY